jgi:hypothetical protein
MAGAMPSDREGPLIVAEQPLEGLRDGVANDAWWPFGRSRQRPLTGTQIHGIWIWLTDRFGESCLTGVGLHAADRCQAEVSQAQSGGIYAPK